jgi:iron complex transport system permease protein
MIVGPARFPWGLAAACGALALLILWSFGVGQAPVSGGDAWRALWAALTGQPSGLAAPIDAIVLEVRAPRVLAALAVGAALSAAGAAYQGLFRNPLVSPDILGVTSGCALGAALAVILALRLGAEPRLMPLLLAAGSLLGGLAIRVFVLGRAQPKSNGTAPDGVGDGPGALEPS